MGRAAIGAPNKFSLQISELVKREVLASGGDHSGRWLSEKSGMSATYLRERIIGSRPFNTNDVFNLATIFGYDVQDFVAKALEIRLTAKAK